MNNAKSPTGFASAPMPAKISPSSGGKGVTVPSSDTGHKPGSAIKGFSGSGVKPGKV